MVTIADLGNYVEVSAPSKEEAFSVAFDHAAARSDVSWSFEGPIETGMCNGHIRTGYMYILKAAPPVAA